MAVMLIGEMTAPLAPHRNRLLTKNPMATPVRRMAMSAAAACHSTAVNEVNGASSNTMPASVFRVIDLVSTPRQ
jgi:hypothetical protein